MADVVIYTKSGCPYCTRALAHYTDKGITFDEFSVDGNPGVQKKVADLAGGKRIVPVVVDKGEVKVGWDGG